MERILVVGAGFMGSGIAQVCARAGYAVHLMDVRKEALERALSEIGWSAKKLYKKGMIETPPETLLNRITPEDNLASAGRVDWVIECAPEVEKLKHELFEKLDGLAPAETVLATNTSSIPITRIARVTRRPERVMGLHFFGPVPLMGIVEVVKAEQTAEDVFDRGVAFVRSLGKTPIVVKKDIPGFVMNRVFAAAFREAVDLVAQEVVTLEDLDTGMRLGYGWRSGPFEIADNAGLDTFSLIMKAFKNLGEEYLTPRADMIQKMVEQGRLGRKTGKGFYSYTPEGKRFSLKNNPLSREV